MKKFNVLILSLTLLGLSIYGLYASSNYVQLLISLNLHIIYARIALVAVLLAYVLIPSFRLYTTRTMLFIGGILLMVLGAISIGSPTLLMSHSSIYLQPGDIFTLFEAGILSIVLSVELSASRSSYIARSIRLIQLKSMNAQSKLLSFDPASDSRKKLKVQPLFRNTFREI